MGFGYEFVVDFFVYECFVFCYIVLVYVGYYCFVGLGGCWVNCRYKVIVFIVDLVVVWFYEVVMINMG